MYIPFKGVRHNLVSGTTLKDVFVGREFFPRVVLRRHDRCRYQDVLNYLNLSKSNDLFSMSRPVENHKSTTKVTLIVAISAILDVRETDQTFVPYIWIHMIWKNEYIHWNPADFCEIEHVLVPTDVLWKPDIIIEEMIEKDKAPPSDFLKIRSNGNVEYRNDQVVISSCKMRVYKFPFDVQSCNLSIKSLMHSDEELYFSFDSNSTVLTELSRMVMQTQYEWLFIKMTVTSKTDNISIDMNQTSVIHTIYMRRRSLLYIANFLMPIVFFLCLDLSSFLISESGGEKLGFKVTVLLAVTVMQLILNEILPCSSERIPLIAVYCIGIFTLMMLSLLETILVMHLMEKDAASPQDSDTNRDHKLTKHKLSKSSIHHCFKGEFNQRFSKTSGHHKIDSTSQLVEVSLALGKVSDELEQIEKTMSALSEEKEEKKPGDWTRVAKKINKAFMIFYFSAVTVFLAIIFTLWSRSEEEQ
ncbi:5-hydroxytryptamine receptor 3A-like [Salarias fasciatus]|uniref:5-hydroxytryptamine receptor 3A-like n=1 Tax=Salarias fasciatus TaxID=181472 RepID=UPI0011767841|nr:5-hydroxytryptamine receptor 3A-like [Salarias fasciatus]